MRLWQQATLAAALAAAAPVALAQDTTQPIHIASPTTVPARKSPTTDYAALFAHFDENLNNGQGLSIVDNTTGKLAWLESYQLLAYMHAWRATSNTLYLDKVATQFQRVLQMRDDRLGRADIYTSAPRLGWGTASYDKAGWHVFVVHTGMICLGPAEFIRAVHANPALQKDYGATATVFLRELQAMVEDAQPGFHTNDRGEGWYEDPGLKGIVPLNMSNAMGSVMVELYAVTGDTRYRDRAASLATYFKNSLRDNGDGGWNWAYWPKKSSDPVPVGEDISHAAINVDFAARCTAAGIVFTPQDMDRFALTWLRKVRRSNGTWSGYVDGKRATKPEAYVPQACGRWLTILPVISPAHAQAIYHDVERAFAGFELKMPSHAFGIANLALYRNYR